MDIITLYEDADQIEHLVGYGFSHGQALKRYKNSRERLPLGLTSLIMYRRNRRMKFEPDHKKERPHIRVIQ